MLIVGVLFLAGIILIAGRMSGWGWFFLILALLVFI